MLKSALTIVLAAMCGLFFGGMQFAGRLSDAGGPWRAPRCPGCGARYPFARTLPIWGDFMGGRREPCCGAAKPLRVPLSELLGAACFTAVAALYGATLLGAVYAVACAILLAVSRADLERRVIPDRAVAVLMALGAVLAAFSRDMPFYDRLIGLAAVSVPLLLAADFLGGLGGGDVKLMAACGLLLGWKLSILALLFGSVFASAAGLSLMLRHRATRKTEIPYGPFLGLGTVCAMLLAGAASGAVSSLLR